MLQMNSWVSWGSQQSEFELQDELQWVPWGSQQSEFELQDELASQKSEFEVPGDESLEV